MELNNTNNNEDVEPTTTSSTNNLHNLSMDECLSLLKEKYPNDPLVKQIITLHEEDSYSIVYDSSYFQEKIDHYSNLLIPVVLKFIDSIKGCVFPSFDWRTSKKDGALLKPRLNKRTLLNKLWLMNDFKALGYPDSTSGDLYHQFYVHAFEEHDEIAIIRKDVEKYIHGDRFPLDVEYYLTSIKQNNYKITIRPNQPLQYYLDLLKMFAYVYDLIQKDKRISLLINSAQWINDILSGDTTEEIFWDDGVVHYTGIDNEKGENTSLIMKTQIEPHIKVLQRFLAQRKGEEGEGIDTSSLPPSNPNLNESMKESVHCWYGADNYAYEYHFSLIDTIYEIVNDALIHPNTFHESPLFRQFVELLPKSEQYFHEVIYGKETGSK